MNYKLQPAEEHVFGQIPFKFSWEAEEVLEIVPTSTPARNMTFGRDDNDSKYGFGGKLIVLEPTAEGGTRSVSLRRKSDGMILHNWVFHQIGMMLMFVEKIQAIHCSSAQCNASIN